MDQKGDSVFILPNFVTHRYPQERWERFFAIYIHGSLLRAIIDYVVIATGDPTLISFGNASLQSCHSNQVIAQTGAADVVVSLPKLKTHEKVAITCALKGTVGAIAEMMGGNKKKARDYLSRHKFLDVRFFLLFVWTFFPRSVWSWVHNLKNRNIVS